MELRYAVLLQSTALAKLSALEVRTRVYEERVLAVWELEEAVIRQMEAEEDAAADVSDQEAPTRAYKERVLKVWEREDAAILEWEAKEATPLAVDFDCEALGLPVAPRYGSARPFCK